MALLVQNLLKLVLAQRDQRPLYPLAAAIAAILHGAGLQNFQVEVGHDLTQHMLRVVVLVQNGGDVAGGHDTALHLGDSVLPGAGHQLDQIATGGLDALIPVNEHPQSAGGGDLLGLHEVGGVALAMGLLFDLTQPGLIPCFHILAFLLAALAAAAVANYLITPGLLCAVLMGVAALVITDGLQILLMTYQQGVAFSAASSLAGREILVTLPLTVLVYLPFRWVRRRIYSE